MPKPITELNLNDFAAFLFDLDGTLIDGSDRHFIKCVVETGKEFGREELVIPPGMLLGEFLSSEGFDDEGIREFQQKNKHRMLNTHRPVAFHDDGMSFLTEFEHVARALVTNCNDWELAMTEEVLDLRALFEIVIHKTPEVPSKPHGQMYHNAANLLNAHPEKCLVFEDSVTGIRAGKHAGMTVVALDRGMHDRFEEADFLIQSFDELR